MIMAHKHHVLLALSVCTSLTSTVHGSAELFAYYETPLEGLGGRGPSQWHALPIHHNQCGGIGQTTGFGQSPVVIPKEVNETCDSDLGHYEFQAGTCTWDDLLFKTISNGVTVAPKSDTTCSFGKMKIPDNHNWYEAIELRIHSSSEHSVDGTYYPNEIHVVHREVTSEEHSEEGEHHSEGEEHSGEGEHKRHLSSDEHGGGHGASYAIFATFLDSASDTEHEAFEPFIKGWEAAAQQTEEYCALNPQGSQVFVPNSVLTSRQMRLTCPEIASSVSTSGIVLQDDGIPELKPVDFPQDFPSLYEDLPTEGFGIYSYRGGLTTVPCTEIVHWTLLDTPMHVSRAQVERLRELILCFVEISTCRHATIANEFGLTNRPPQPLNGRTILHRCPDGPQRVEALQVPIPPTTSFIGEEEEVEPAWSVLYPWFAVALGFIVFYLLSRYLHVIPYTAVMFMLGTFMGIGIVGLENTDQLSNSIRIWENIDGELLLLVFLPGLLFRDSYGMNVHLFVKSFWQCVLFAFPMVLAGTTLLAVVAFYILPYGWSFSLSMTFGSILSATDPVAVSALLNEVGAPPRLKTHISGESLLNDGSAIVFFTIFASIFFFELGIPGLGEDIDVAQGFALFFRMSLGAVAIGLAFGLGLVLVLFMLNRRFNAEENIVQVMATIGVAYLTYYVADVVCGTSGVIAIVTCGIMTKAVGSRMINDQVMMEKFWVLVEHILNTVLFTLGGTVWGTVISNSDPTRTETFDAKDWGYLFLLYILMMVIRTFLMFAFLPVVGRIGLKSNWQETAFMSFGGLRGAVGIALAIGLDSELHRDTLPGDPRRDFTSQLFGLTGGIAFMTLIINGTLAGPFLRKLGLADSSEVRAKTVERFQQTILQNMLDGLMKMLGDDRFSQVDFALVKHHVHYMQVVTKDDLKRAVKRNKESTPPHKYKEPNLESFKPFLDKGDYDELKKLATVSASAKFKSIVGSMSLASSGRCESNLDNEPQEEEDEVINSDVLMELRKVFLELLEQAYQKLIEKGEIDSREGFMVYVLNSSLQVAADEVAKGNPLCDYAACKVIRRPWNKKARYLMKHPQEMLGKKQNPKVKKFYKVKADVHRTIALIQGHELAQESFKNDFCNGQLLSAAESTIIKESNVQVSAANEYLRAQDQDDMKLIVSHLLCSILLNNSAIFVGNLIHAGLLKDQEGEEYIEEFQHQLTDIKKCHGGSSCNDPELEFEATTPGSTKMSQGSISSGVPSMTKGLPQTMMEETSWSEDFEVDSTSSDATPSVMVDIGEA